MDFIKTEKLPFDVVEAIKARISTRSFEEKPLSEENKTTLLGKPWANSLRGWS